MLTRSRWLVSLALSCMAGGPIAARAQEAVEHEVVEYRLEPFEIIRLSGVNCLSGSARTMSRIAELGRDGWVMSAIGLEQFEPSLWDWLDARPGGGRGIGGGGECPNRSFRLLFVRTSHNWEAQATELAELKKAYEGSLQSLQSLRDEVLHIVQQGLAATLVERFQEPIRASICGYVDRRLNERFPPDSAAAAIEPQGSCVAPASAPQR